MDAAINQQRVNHRPGPVPERPPTVLLPDRASPKRRDGWIVATTSAGKLLAREHIAVRYVTEPGLATQAVRELLALPEHGNPWGLDLETARLPAFRLDCKAGLDPWRSTIRLVQVYPGGETGYVFDIAALGGLSPLSPLWERRWVAHNAVFEFKQLLHHGVTLTHLDCTLLQDNALHDRRRALATLAKELLGWHMDKTLQVSDWGGALSREQREYAALDAVAAYRLALLQTAQLQARGRERSYGLMRDAQPAIAALERAGCPFDAAAHAALIAPWQAMAAAVRAELDPWLNGANPDNPAHRAGLAPPALEPLKRYLLAKKVLKAYGEGYALHLSPVTGRLHPGYFLGGTATGRLTSEPPNLQQASRDPAFRALFAPCGGRRLVVGDYRQLELRVAAQRSNDPRIAVQEGGTEGFNTLVQSGAAECLLAALAALDLPGGAALAAIVDNELVVECDPQQTGRVAAEVERAMTAGFLAIFPNGAIHDLVAAHSGPNWAAAKGYFQAGSSVLTLPNGAAESSDPNGTVALRPP